MSSQWTLAYSAYSGSPEAFERISGAPTSGAPPKEAGRTAIVLLPSLEISHPERPATGLSLAS